MTGIVNYECFNYENMAKKVGGKRKGAGRKTVAFVFANN